MFITRARKCENELQVNHSVEWNILLTYTIMKTDIHFTDLKWEMKRLQLPAAV